MTSAPHVTSEAGPSKHKERQYHLDCYILLGARSTGRGQRSYSPGNSVLRGSSSLQVNTYLESVDFRYRRILTTILLVVVSEEHDVFTHPPHMRVFCHHFIILPFRI